MTAYRWLKSNGVAMRRAGEWRKGRPWTEARRKHHPIKPPVDIKAQRRSKAIAKFWSLVSAPDENGCRNWQGHVMAHGYGRVGFMREKVLAHRLAWILTNGDIPPHDSHRGTLVVCHKCDNPLCCNAGHLFLGTQADNNIDRHRKGRSMPPKNPARLLGTRSPAAKLSENIVLDARAAFAAGKISISELARKHCVNNSVMNRAIHGKTWRHV